MDIKITPRKPKINIGINGKESEIDINAITIPGTFDYNKLNNKPQINNVELIGNISLEDLFPDGLIINGGTSGGWT